MILEAHDGPINALERSPFFKDIILTAGGWTFAIWKEKNIVIQAVSSLILINNNFHRKNY